MTKQSQLRALAIFLALGAPLSASCAKEANTLEPDDSDGSGASSSSGSSAKAGSTSKSGSANNAFGGTTSKGGMSSAGTDTGGDAGEAPLAEGGDSTGAGGSAGTSGGGKGGSGGSGGSASTGVDPEVLARASVVLHYETNQTTATTNIIFMKMFIENKSDDALPMANVKVRYWFTAEATPTLETFYHGGNVSEPVNTFVLDAANSHVLVTFSSGSVPKTVNNDTSGSEFQLQIEGGSFNQSNDFSWNPALTKKAPNDKITVYLADKLIWGCEPDSAGGKCFDDDAGAGGAGGGPP